jgi:hypothetical protein
MKNFVNRVVLQDTKTIPQIRSFWGVGRNNGIDSESLSAWIDSVASVLDRSQKLNFIRWDILSQKVHMNPQARGSYSKEVAYLKDYITKRILWMDTRLGYTYTNITTPTIEDDMYYVWDVLGRPIYQGKDKPSLQQGIYIIRHNGKVEMQMINQ